MINPSSTSASIRRGSQIPPGFGWKRHIEFDHYRRVAASGAVTIAWSVADVGQAIRRALADPSALSAKRRAFIQQTFGETLDGESGRRVAEKLVEIALQ